MTPGKGWLRLPDKKPQKFWPDFPPESVSLFDRHYANTIVHTCQPRPAWDEGIAAAINKRQFFRKKDN